MSTSSIPGGAVVASLASGVHMQGGRHPVRRGFVWNGRTSGGRVAPDGIYYIRVSLIHQGRSVLISNNAGALPVTVETVAPHPRVTGVAPGLIPRAGVTGATVSYTGNAGLPGRMLIYRTDLPGAPKLVKSFPARPGGRTTWDGTVAGGRSGAPGHLPGGPAGDRPRLQHRQLPGGAAACRGDDRPRRGDASATWPDCRR